MLSGSAREATTRQQKQLNKFSCFLNRELRYNYSIARSELFTSCGRFRGGFRPSRPHGTNVLGCDASLWIALSAAPHTSLVGGMTKITDLGWASRRCFNTNDETTTTQTKQQYNNVPTTKPQNNNTTTTMLQQQHDTTTNQETQQQNHIDNKHNMTQHKRRNHNNKTTTKQQQHNKTTTKQQRNNTRKKGCTKNKKDQKTTTAKQQTHPKQLRRDRRVGHHRDLR